MPQGDRPGDGYASYPYMASKKLDDIDLMFYHAEVHISEHMLCTCY
jgi:hypothetical protein